MHRGKHQAKRKHRWLILAGIVLATVALILLPKIIEPVMAYMFRQTDTATNLLEPAIVMVDVEETFNGKTKSDVFVTNHSDIPVYIRATLVQYWKKDGGIVPKPAGAETPIEMGSSNWLQSGDVYYYISPVSAGGKTENLIDQATVKMPEGYTFHMDIYTEAIQAEPLRAVEEAWGVTLDENGQILSVS